MDDNRGGRTGSVERAARARRRSGGAAARRAARSGGGPGTQLTYIKRKIKVYEVLDEEGLALIEDNADTVLEEIGIKFRDDAEALAAVEGGRRRRQGRRACISRAGSAALAAEDRAADLHPACAQSRSARSQIGGNATVFAPVYGPPFVRDLDGRPPLRARSRISAIS